MFYLPGLFRRFRRVVVPSQKCGGGGDPKQGGQSGENKAGGAAGGVAAAGGEQPVRMFERNSFFSSLSLLLMNLLTHLE